MDFTISPLTPADAGAALDILTACSRRGEVLYKPLEREDFLARFFGPDRWGFAARSGDRLVGWIHGAAQSRFLPGETAENTPLYLTLLLVAEGFRRQGIGRLLMDTAVEKAREAGARALVLETQSCNGQAIRFYRRNGFSLVGFDLTAYSQTDVQKKEVRLEMARPVCGQTKE